MRCRCSHVFSCRAVVRDVRVGHALESTSSKAISASLIYHKPLMIDRGHRGFRDREFMHRKQLTIDEIGQSAPCHAGSSRRSPSEDGSFSEGGTNHLLHPTCSRRLSEFNSPAVRLRRIRRGGRSTLTCRAVASAKEEQTTP